MVEPLNLQISTKRWAWPSRRGGELAAESPRGPPRLTVGDQVSVPRSNGSTSDGRITHELSDGRVRVEFKNEKGQLVYKEIDPSKLTPSYRFRSEKVADYVTGSGAVVRVDYNSSQFKAIMRETMDAFDRQGVGFHSPRGPPSTDEMQKASDAWLSQVQKYESVVRGSNYDRARNQIIQNNGGVADLGEIAACRGAVCRELSLIGSVALAESGFSTRIGRGIVGGPNGGAHAWIEFLDPRTNQVVGVVDSNYQRKFFANPQDYYQKMQITGTIKYTVVARPR